MRNHEMFYNFPHNVQYQISYTDEAPNYAYETIQQMPNKDNEVNENRDT